MNLFWRLAYLHFGVPADMELIGLRYYNRTFSKLTMTVDATKQTETRHAS